MLKNQQLKKFLLKKILKNVVVVNQKLKENLVDNKKDMKSMSFFLHSINNN